MRFLSAIFSILFYTVFSLIVAVVVIVHSLGFWLGSDGGTLWLKSQISMATADSGYHVELGDVRIVFMGIELSSLRVEGDDGLKIVAQNTSLSLNPFPLTMKILRISLSADGVDVLQTPTQTETAHNVSPEAKAIEIPDLFFNAVQVRLNLKRITLPDSNGMAIALKTRQSVSQQGNGTIDMTGVIKIAIDGQDMMPDRIENKINIGSDNVKIAAIKLHHKMYDATLSGQYNVYDGTVSVQGMGNTNMLNLLVDKNFEDLNATINLAGTVDMMEGGFALRSGFKDEAININAALAITDKEMSLSAIKGLSDDVSLSGDVMLPFDTAIAEGQVVVATNNPSTLLAMAGVNEAISATISTRLDLFAQQGKQALKAQATIRDMNWQDLEVATIQADAQMDDVSMAVMPKVDLELVDLFYDGTKISKANMIVGLGAENGYDVSLTAKGQNGEPFTLNGRGQLQDTSPLSVRIDSLHLGMQKGFITVSGHMTEEAMDLAVKGEGVQPESLPFVTLPDLPLMMKDMDIRISKSPALPMINGNITLVTTGDDMPQTVMNGDFGYQDRKASLVLSATGQGIEKFDVHGSIPFGLSFYPFVFDLSDKAVLSGKVDALFDMDVLKSFVTDDYDIEGRLKADAAISGTISDIGVDGTAVVNNARFRDPASGLSLTDINADMRFDRDTITLSSLTAKGDDKTGTLAAKGRFGLASLSSPDIMMDIDARNFHVLSGSPYDVRLNADLAFKTRGEKYELAGDLSLGEIVVQLPENEPDSIPALNIVAPEEENKPGFLDRTELSIQFHADNKIFIRGYGVDTEMGGNLDITGFASDPQVNGELSSIRGRYEEFGRQFTLEQAIVRFQGSIPPSPYLDIIATTRIDDLVAQVNIGGNPTKPTLAFSSDPVLPEDEVLSHILFGEDITTISPFQAIQLANTLRRLSGNNTGPSLNVLGGIRDVTGLDDIRIEGSGTDTRVGVGKYISDKVYLDVSKGAAEDSGTARVEIEVTPSVSVEGKVGQTGETDSTIFWRWDY